ncbi:MAG: PKD domain-containing protein, partial [Vicinamibacterales bacterium]
MTARSLPSRLSRVFVNALAVVTVVLTWPAPAMAQQPAVVSYELVSYRFVRKDHLSRSLFLFTYRATLSNAGDALSGATATAVSLSPDLTVVDGSLTFGPVANGGTSVSTDTFSFQMERRDHLDWNSLLQWTITATSANRAPTANAGADQATAGIGLPVVLDGSGSSDPDGDTLTYQWTIALAPEGSSAALGGSSTASPSFVPDRKGVYAIRLTVNDGTWSAADEVTVTVENTPPTAGVGPGLLTFVGQPVQLDGTGSSDVDGDPLTYWWTLVSAPPQSASSLSDATAPAPMFLVDKAGTYTLQLLVSDGIATSAPAAVSVVTQNSSPVSNAGPDQTAPVGTYVTLDGSGSSDVDGDPLTYSWAFGSRPAGSAAVLTDTTAVNPSFIIDQPGTYQLHLVTSDGTLTSGPDTVIVST